MPRAFVTFLGNAYEMQTYADYDGDESVFHEEAAIALATATEMVEVIANFLATPWEAPPQLPHCENEATMITITPSPRLVWISLRIDAAGPGLGCARNRLYGPKNSTR